MRWDIFAKDFNISLVSKKELLNALFHCNQMIDGLMFEIFRENLNNHLLKRIASDEMMTEFRKARFNTLNSTSCKLGG